MNVNQQERVLLRELAQRYAELAALPVQTERYNRGRDINDLKPRRPVVWIDEIPWHEMNIENKLTMVCENHFAREMEWFFRSTLYRWEYFQADMVVENFYPISKRFDNTGIGINISEHTLAADDKNHIISHDYGIDQLDTIEKVEALKEPIITARPEEDAKRVAMAEEVLCGILPVKLRGHYVYYAPWDDIPRYRGVTAALTDMIENPELIHATMRKFTQFGLSRARQMEAQNLFDPGIGSLHCTPPYVSDLPTGTNMKSSWFRAMAQLLTDVSPSMWKEFELDYVKPLAEMFGLSYYGCCEVIDAKIPLLKTITNLRKIGVPTRCNPEACAEQIGGDYVYAHKPNPAFVSGSFNPDAVSAEIMRVIEACKAHGCAYEFVLKDISTVSYKPENLIKWNETVQSTIDRYY